MGSDAKTVLGQLVGTEIAGAFGRGGLGSLGSGAGAAGEGEGTIGVGKLATIGDYGQGDGKDRGYGHGVGQLAKRTQPHGPDIIPGIATSRGALDKEIIRRIVRRNINQVRYCYDQALTRQPTLAGRVVVQFTIAGNGTVIASLLGNSTLGAPAVESCIVQAVKRWEFPKPEGGGLVMVSYPFQLTPAGG
jgi:TonB family protein